MKNRNRNMDQLREQGFISVIPYRFVYNNDKDCNIAILYVIYYIINFIYMVVVCCVFNIHPMI